MRLTEASDRYLTVRQQDGYSRYTLTLDDFRAHLAHYGHLQPASLGHKIRAIKSLFGGWKTKTSVGPTRRAN